MDPKQQFGRLGTLGGLGTLAATGNPGAQGQAAGLGTLGGLGVLAATSKHPGMHPMKQKRLTPNFKQVQNEQAPRGAPYEAKTMNSKF